MKIEQIDRVAIYYVKTDELGFENLIRYGSDDWTVQNGAREIALVNPEEFEEEFQHNILHSFYKEN